MLGRIVCTLILALIVGIAMVRPGAALSGYTLSDPVSYENLSVLMCAKSACGSRSHP
jgi:hypothetical protein